MNCCVTAPSVSVTAARDVDIPCNKEVDTKAMVMVPAGRWEIGYDGPEAYPEDGEGPVRKVEKPAFLIDRSAVTNAAFSDFVDDIGYVTDAERSGVSFVFYAQLHPGALSSIEQQSPGMPDWWLLVRGASWRCPDGPGSTADDRADHPVVHVSWRDASAFAAWAGKRLPGEEEWEIAARGGLKGKIYPWGNELLSEGNHRCNIWQGRFPHENTGDDGYLSTAPVTAYAPNGFGLFNMVGNVWEWCADTWLSGSAARAMRGGSYLCQASYCNRYRVSARTGNLPHASSSHTGFRCAANGVESWDA